VESQKNRSGKKLLVKQIALRFEKENVNYYSFKDFVKAKRKYIKCTLEGECI
jgi:hypothetical protein